MKSETIMLRLTLALAIALVGGLVVVLPTAIEAQMNPCDYANWDYDTNSTGSYTSQGSQCLDYYFPKDKSGDRDYSYFDPPPGSTAQDYPIPDFNPGTGTGSGGSSSGSSNNDVDPKIQEEIDKTKQWLGDINEMQTWNCIPGDINCMIYGYGSPESDGYRYYGVCN